MCRHETRNEDRHANPERTAPYPKKLIEIALQDAGAIGEISTECYAEFLRCLRLSFGIGEVNDDFNGLVGSQFAGPTDNIFLRLSVEISFAKRKRVEGMEELSDVIDA